MPVYTMARVDGFPYVFREGVRSALHVALRRPPAPAYLVCTHPRTGFFHDRHKRLAATFAPVLSPR